MLNRRQTIASIPNPHSKVTIRRAKSTNTTISSSSGNCRPNLDAEATRQQAKAAAQHAYEGNRSRQSYAIPTHQAYEGPRGRQSCDISVRQQYSNSDLRSQGSTAELQRCRVNKQRGVPSAEQQAPYQQQSFNSSFVRCPKTPPAEGHLGRSRFDPSVSSIQDSEPATIRRRKSMGWIQPAPLQGARRLDSGPSPAEYTTSGYSPNQVGSVPSSYRRLTHSKSSFSMSTASYTPYNRDISNVIFTSEPKPEAPRKSMSFLRGGTDFMPESVRKQQEQKAKQNKERKSFYMSSSAREALPAIYLESKKYKGKSEKGDWGAVRFSVKKTARKISESVFSSVKSIFGKGNTRESDEPLRIPEQHITSSRLHFRDYVAPEDVFEDFSGLGSESSTPRAKIRSNYVISRAPMIHLVGSSERIRSDIGSVVSPSIASPSTPARPASDRVFSAATVNTIETDATTNWNSTADSRFTAQAADRLESIDEAFGNSLRGNDLYVRPQPKGRLNVDVRRLYSALVKKLDDDPPKLKSVPKPRTENDDSYMTSGTGMHSEERSVSGPRDHRTLSGNSNLPEQRKKDPTPAPVEWDIPDEQPPPVPEIPRMWLDVDAKRVAFAAHREPAGRPAASRSTLCVVNGEEQAPISIADSPSLYSVPSPQFPERRWESMVPVDHSVSTDAALSACHLQMLKDRSAALARRAANIQSSRQQPSVPPRPRSGTEASVQNHAFDTETLRRSKSNMDYRTSNAPTPVQRTKAAIPSGITVHRSGTPGLARGGLRIMDVNLSQAEPGLYQPLRTKGSRVSFSGRASRASMRDFDVGQAVMQQFGPLAGEWNSSYQHGDYAYSDSSAFL